MDVAFLLLLPLVGGYYLANTSYVFRYRTAREDGHRLYFRSASLGVVLFCAVIIVRSLLLLTDWYRHFEVYLSSLMLPLVKEPEKGYQFPLAIVSIYSIVLGPLIGYGGNAFLNREAWLSKALKENDLERLVHDAARRKLAISLTMANSKVYVGFVVTSVDPARDLKTLGILPIISGYRDKDNGKITFTTDYRPIYELESQAPNSSAPALEINVRDFELILPTDKIQSCNIFDFKAYDIFNRSGDDDSG